VFSSLLINRWHCLHSHRRSRPVLICSIIGLTVGLQIFFACTARFHLLSGQRINRQPIRMTKLQFVLRCRHPRVANNQKASHNDFLRHVIRGKPVLLTFRCDVFAVSNTINLKRS